jgi:anti-anti-sigma factor
MAYVPVSLQSGRRVVLFLVPFKGAKMVLRSGWPDLINCLAWRKQLKYFDKRPFLYIFVELIICIMVENCKTHKIYANYPMDALSLRELESDINDLDVQLGDWVLVDCAGMTYICSSGLRVFLTLNKNVTAKGGKLIIRNLEPLVKTVFDMSGFSQIFNIE